MSISVDSRTCPGALECGLCLEVCRERVLMAKPWGSVVKENRSWRVVPVLVSRCEGCLRCQNICPEKAIVVR